MLVERDFLLGESVASVLYFWWILGFLLQIP
jgi:hypothetical protein